MRCLFVLLAALAPFAASAITATKAYVDRRDAEVATNAAVAVASVADAALLAIYYPEGNVTNVSQITTEGLTYTYDETNHTATLTDGKSATGDVVIPWKVVRDGKEYKVVAVGDKAFCDYDFVFNAKISSVAIPTTVTSIGSEAFFGCSSLKSVSLPSVTSIGMGAFCICPSLKSVSLPSVTSLENSAFIDCRSLTSVDFGPTPRDAVPTSDNETFVNVPTTCRIIIPLGMYDEWIAAPGWRDLYAQGYKFVGYADAADIPKSAADVGAFPADAGASLQAQVTAQGAYLNAEDARFVSTNYNSTTRLPEAYFEIKLPDGTWEPMWREMTRWNWFFDGPWTSVTNSLATKGEKEWGFYDAATGAPAPDGFAWVSMPRIAICAGAAYQRVVDTAGGYWVLESNGLVTDINGTTNGFFRITDEEGVAQFEVVKGDKRTIFAAPGSQTVEIMGVTHVYTSYEVEGAAEPPVAYFTRSLQPVEWFASTDSACPFNATWTQSGTTWTCEWWPKANEPSGFMRAAFTIGGETFIRNAAPVEMTKIVIDGVTYTLTVETIDGKKVLGLK